MCCVFFAVPGWGPRQSGSGGTQRDSPSGELRSDPKVLNDEKTARDSPIGLRNRSCLGCEIAWRYILYKVGCEGIGTKIIYYVKTSFLVGSGCTFSDRVDSSESLMYVHMQVELL